ncbi:MAG TPA: lysylphosphatidylglycerol synthase domain-containing protein [Candidatus Saccharimonadales bacterium]|nr:lysylphosphatidylglycerol synthase domain-containing protein [Candidatus Saccharimonadales bacterium]
MKKNLRLAISLLATLTAVYIILQYLLKHRSLLTQLSHVSLLIILLLVALYILIFGVLVLILGVILKICYSPIGKQENVLLNAYSLFINFFIPGQGGPAFRGIYLKKRRNLLFRNYIAGSLLYYAMYGLLSICFVLAGSRPWWQTALASAVVVGLSFPVVNMLKDRSVLRKTKLNLNFLNVGLLWLVTLSQLLLQFIIYFIELHNANKHIAVHQAIAYSGIANLALFVALTPGAIGIRESFLVLSERLHHISSANIIVANVIDRSVYLVFLGLALILIISLHAKDKLLIKKAE